LEIGVDFRLVCEGASNHTIDLFQRQYRKTVYDTSGDMPLRNVLEMLDLLPRTNLQTIPHFLSLIVDVPAIVEYLLNRGVA
jgi:hypothetical protein